jgi:dihydroxyacid dehydratase/phosphogluconate dehydratase
VRGGRHPLDPIDGVVLLTGCDKTTPALLIAAATVPAGDRALARADARRPLPGTAGRRRGNHLGGAVIRPYDAPLLPQAGFHVLRGNLFEGAIMKTSVIDARLPPAQSLPPRR